MAARKFGQGNDYTASLYEFLGEDAVAPPPARREEGKEEPAKKEVLKPTSAYAAFFQDAYSMADESNLKPAAFPEQKKSNTSTPTPRVSSSSGQFSDSIYNEFEKDGVVRPAAATAFVKEHRKDNSAKTFDQNPKAHTPFLREIYSLAGDSANLEMIDKTLSRDSPQPGSASKQVVANSKKLAEVHTQKLYEEFPELIKPGPAFTPESHKSSSPKLPRNQQPAGAKAPASTKESVRTYLADIMALEAGGPATAAASAPAPPAAASSPTPPAAASAPAPPAAASVPAAASSRVATAGPTTTEGGTASRSGGASAGLPGAALAAAAVVVVAGVVVWMLARRR